jgi:hypothetical protein
MEIPECREISARNFFVPILDVTAQYAGRFRGYWGRVTDARYHDQQLWLNGGGLLIRIFGTCHSIAISAHHLMAFSTAFHNCGRIWIERVAWVRLI